MFDDNCALHTAAALYNGAKGTNVGVRDVFRMTGFMEGPAHSSGSIAEMLRMIGVGRGEVNVFDTVEQAERWIMLSGIGTRFAFGYSPLPGSSHRTGHVMVAMRGLSRVTYYDHQIHERVSPYASINVERFTIPDRDHRYFVFC